MTHINLLKYSQDLLSRMPIPSVSKINPKALTNLARKHTIQLAVIVTLVSFATLTYLYFSRKSPSDNQQDEASKQPDNKGGNSADTRAENTGANLSPPPIQPAIRSVDEFNQAQEESGQVGSAAGSAQQEVVPKKVPAKAALVVQGESSREFIPEGTINELNIALRVLQQMSSQGRSIMRLVLSDSSILQIDVSEVLTAILNGQGAQIMTALRQINPSTSGPNLNLEDTDTQEVVQHHAGYSTVSFEEGLNRPARLEADQAPGEVESDSSDNEDWHDAEEIVISPANLEAAPEAETNNQSVGELMQSAIATTIDGPPEENRDTILAEDDFEILSTQDTSITIDDLLNLKATNAQGIPKNYSIIKYLTHVTSKGKSVFKVGKRTFDRGYEIFSRLDLAKACSHFPNLRYGGNPSFPGYCQINDLDCLGSQGIQVWSEHLEAQHPHLCISSNSVNKHLSVQIPDLQDDKTLYAVPVVTKGTFNNHIVTFAYHQPSHTVLFFDSFGFGLLDHKDTSLDKSSISDDDISKLWTVYRDIMEKYKKGDDYPEVWTNTKAQQEDNYNCGVYVMKWIQYLASSTIQGKEAFGELKDHLEGDTRFSLEYFSAAYTSRAEILQAMLPTLHGLSSNVPEDKSSNIDDSVDSTLQKLLDAADDDDDY